MIFVPSVQQISGQWSNFTPHLGEFTLGIKMSRRIKINKYHIVPIVLNFNVNS